jgi:hypothetical protein
LLRPFVAPFRFRGPFSVAEPSAPTLRMIYLFLGDCRKTNFRHDRDTADGIGSTRWNAVPARNSFPICWTGWSDEAKKTRVPYGWGTRVALSDPLVHLPRLFS